MKVFIAHSSVQDSLANDIAAKARAAGFEVFNDEESLPPGRSYDRRIDRALKQTELLIFLISPESTKPGSYALTELRKYARRHPNPSGRVLAVCATETSPERIPSYIRANITLMKPEGSPATEVIDALLSFRALPVTALEETTARLQSMMIVGTGCLAALTAMAVLLIVAIRAGSGFTNLSVGIGAYGVVPLVVLLAIYIIRLGISAGQVGV